MVSSFAPKVNVHDRAGKDEDFVSFSQFPTLQQQQQQQQQQQSRPKRRGRGRRGYRKGKVVIDFFAA